MQCCNQLGTRWRRSCARIRINESEELRNKELELGVLLNVLAEGVCNNVGEGGRLVPNKSAR